MKKLISLFLSLIMIVSIIAVNSISTFAEDEELQMNGQLTDTMYWNIDEKGILTVSGSGPMPGFNSATSTSPWKGRHDITGLVLSDEITTIADNSFWGCKNITGTLSLPSNLTYIGYSAFRGCSGITGELKIPESVTYIGRYAFAGCSGFSGDIIIPENIREIQSYAFYLCFGFDGNIKLPRHLERIDDFAFNRCEKVKGPLVFPETLKSISWNAFSWCYKLSGDLIFPDSVTSIGADAFQNCFSITGKLKLPKNLETIQARAFDSCHFTGELNIPKTINFIGDSAFYGCNFSGTLHISSNISRIGDYAFKYCQNFKKIIIDEGVESIGNSAFNYCRGLMGTVAIPSTVTSFGNDVFHYCENLDIEACNNSLAAGVCKSQGYVEKTKSTTSHILSPTWNVIYVSQDSEGNPVSINDMRSDFRVYGGQNGKDATILSYNIFDNYYHLVKKLNEETFNNFSVQAKDNVIVEKHLVFVTPKISRGLIVRNWEIVDEPDSANAILITGHYNNSPRVNFDIDETGDETNSIVFLDTEPATFKVTVPTVLPFTVDSDSNVTVANNAAISNKCNGQVKVTNVRAQTTDGWAIVANDTDFREVSVDSKQFTFTLNGDNFGPGNNVNLTLGNEWTVINGKEEMSLPYSGTFAVQSQPKVDLPIANTIFTIAWNKAA